MKQSLHLLAQEDGQQLAEPGIGNQNGRQVRSDRNQAISMDEKLNPQCMRG